MNPLDLATQVNLPAAALTGVIVAGIRKWTSLGPEEGAPDAVKALLRRFSVLLVFVLALALTVVSTLQAGAFPGFWAVLWEGIVTGVWAAGGHAVIKGAVGK